MLASHTITLATTQGLRSSARAGAGVARQPPTLSRCTFTLLSFVAMPLEGKCARGGAGVLRPKLATSCWSPHRCFFTLRAFAAYQLDVGLRLAGFYPRHATLSQRREGAVGRW